MPNEIPASIGLETYDYYLNNFYISILLEIYRYIRVRANSRSLNSTNSGRASVDWLFTIHSQSFTTRSRRSATVFRVQNTAICHHTDISMQVFSSKVSYVRRKTWSWNRKYIFKKKSLLFSACTLRITGKQKSWKNMSLRPNLKIIILNIWF